MGNWRWGWEIFMEIVGPAEKLLISFILTKCTSLSRHICNLTGFCQPTSVLAPQCPKLKDLKAFKKFDLWSQIWNLPTRPCSIKWNNKHWFLKQFRPFTCQFPVNTTFTLMFVYFSHLESKIIRNTLVPLCGPKLHFYILLHHLHPHIIIQT